MEDDKINYLNTFSLMTQGSEVRTESSKLLISSWVLNSGVDVQIIVYERYSHINHVAEWNYSTNFYISILIFFYWYRFEIGITYI